MPRFNGVPVEEPAKSAGPRFQGEAVAPSGRHLTFEEGQALLDKEDLSGAAGGALSYMSGFFEGVPVAGPTIVKGIQHIGAGTRMLAQGGDYDQNLKEVQDMTDYAYEGNPIARTAGNITGAVAATAPAVAAAPGVFGIGAATVPRAIVAGGATGGAIGAADSYARGQSPIIGGALGAGLGAAGPFIGPAFGQAYRYFSGRGAENAAAQIAGTSRPAVNVVARALGSDGAVGTTGANIAAAGPRAMLADAGPATQSVLDTAIQRGGPNAGQAGARINARAAGATDDINTALDSAFGQPRGMVRPLEELRTATQPARAAAYDTAYSQPINYADPRGMALEQMVRGRVPASIINRANNLMRINGEESQQILANVAQDGTVTFERLPDVRQLDYITRALNDVSRAGDGAGALGGNTAEGRAYGGLAREMRNLVGSLVPEYRAALDTAAEPIAQREATLFGQRILSPAVARDEVEGFVTGLSNAELTSLRGGIRSKISETLANVRRSITDGNVDARQGIAALRDLSSDAAREKLTMVLGQREAGNLFRSIDEAARSFELRAGVATNSRTYSRQAAERAVDQATAPDVLEKAAQGKPLGAVQSFLANLFGAGEAQQLARQDAAWGEIANLLTQPATQAGGTLLQALQGVANQIPAIDRAANNIANGVTRGFAVSSPLGGTLTRDNRRQ